MNPDADAVQLIRSEGYLAYQPSLCKHGKLRVTMPYEVQKTNRLFSSDSEQIYNGLGLLAISMHPKFGSHRFAGPAIIFGAGLFSLSIGAMVLGRGR